MGVEREARKAAIGAYKERKSAAGIYVVRCRVSGRAWVGRAPDLRTIGNRLWFTLRCGTSLHRDLQDAWRQHGEASFAFEELERLDDDLSPYAREKALEARLAHWRDTLGADTL